MLYQKILSLALPIYALLSSSINGSTYFVSSDPSSDYKCASDAKCEIYCDEKDNNNNNIYHCGNATDCYFHCDARKCAQDSIINGTQSNNLYITQAKAGQKCFVGATITTPNNGNASFTTESKKGFHSMSVYSGSNAQNIIINTTSGVDDAKKGDEYQGMNIYAATAQFVHVIIGTDLQWSSAVIECPIDSSYAGPYSAPCVIEAPQATLSNINISAPYGVPRNFFMNECEICTNVMILCNDGKYSTYPFNTTDDCWITAKSTASPTISTVDLSLPFTSSYDIFSATDLSQNDSDSKLNNKEEPISLSLSLRIRMIEFYAILLVMCICICCCCISIAISIINCKNKMQIGIQCSPRGRYETEMESESEEKHESSRVDTAPKVLYQYSNKT